MSDSFEEEACQASVAAAQIEPTPFRERHAADLVDLDGPPDGGCRLKRVLAKKPGQQLAIHGY